MVPEKEGKARKIGKQKFVEIKELAQGLRLSETEVRKYIKQARLKGRRIGRDWLFSKTEVVQIMNQQVHNYKGPVKYFTAKRPSS